MPTLTRGARLTYVCIRGVKDAISTALTSVVGYAPGDGSPHQITSTTLTIRSTPESLYYYSNNKVKYDNAYITRHEERIEDICLYMYVTVRIMKQ